MLQFVNNVYYSICKHKLIKAEKKLLAAISGGQDSICLVIILYLLQTQIQYVFDCIWFNHFWQKSSFFTMLHVSKCSYSLSLRITLWLPLTDVFSEQSARDWRHSATQRICIFYQYDLYAQGHSKTDRTETVLFNLIRGTGMPGISALHRTNSQMCLSKNNCYPMHLQLVKQTHWITVSTTSFSDLQLVNQNFADIGFTTISPNRCRLLYYGDALHRISWVDSVTPTAQHPTFINEKDQEKTMFPRVYTPLPYLCVSSPEKVESSVSVHTTNSPEGRRANARRANAWRGNASFASLYGRLKRYAITQIS